MDQWLVTDVKADMIFGTVEASNELAAMDAVDIGLVDWFWQAQPVMHEQLSVRLPFTLADGKWREAAPGTPLPDGDGGGDYQVSDALGRRWWLALPDGNWALFSASWYTTDDTGQVDNPAGPRLVRQEEFLICSDIQDPGGTEIWADYRYVAELAWAPEEASVELAARDFDPDAEINWNGKAFR